MLMATMGGNDDKHWRTVFNIPLVLMRLFSHRKDGTFLFALFILPLFFVSSRLSYINNSLISRQLNLCMIRHIED